MTIRRLQPSRRAVWVSLGVAFLLALALLVVFGASLTGARAQTPVDATTAGASRAAGERLREGASFEALGSFQLTGDRVTFSPLESREQLLVLENLALERVARTVRDAQEPLAWSVVGVVTEYQGSNYLLLTRAVVKRRVDRPEGRR